MNLAVDPFGDLNGAFVDINNPGQLTLDGWAIDPDTTGPIQVHVYVNGQWGGQGTADSSHRPDVDAAFPFYAPNHGFRFNVPGYAGDTVCAYGINDPGAPGNNALLGCIVAS